MDASSERASFTFWLRCSRIACKVCIGLLSWCAHAIAGRVGFLPVLVARTALKELSTINHKNERILRKSADLFVIPSVFCDMGGDFLRRLPFRRKKTRTGRVRWRKLHPFRCRVNTCGLMSSGPGWWAGGWICTRWQEWDLSHLSVRTDHRPAQGSAPAAPRAAPCASCSRCRPSTRCAPAWQRMALSGPRCLSRCPTSTGR